MASEETRTGRPRAQGLTDFVFLMVLSGLSCTRPVILPSADSGLDDAGADVAADASGSYDGARWSGDRFPENCRSNAHAQVYPLIVQMVIALDRSSSMQRLFDGSTTKLSAAQSAIRQAISEHTGIDFALEPFPCAGGPSCSCSGGSGCCTTSPKWLVPPSSIDNQLICAPLDGGCPVYGSDSPSHLALRQSRDFLLNDFSADRAIRFILLITDKDPACSADAPIDACGMAKVEAVTQRNASIQTFVLALNSDPNSTPCLQNIANANATAGSPSQFSTAQNQQELGQKIRDILANVEMNHCRFYVSSEGRGQQPYTTSQVWVMVNDKYVQSGRGYSYDPFSKVLSLDDELCAEWLQSGAQAPTVTFCQPQ